MEGKIAYLAYPFEFQEEGSSELDLLPHNFLDGNNASLKIKLSEFLSLSTE